MKSQAILRIDPHSSTPVYRQIVDGIRTLLVEQQLNPGDTLPTVRELALDMGVHFNTVAEAYRLLAAEGWLELKRKRGAMVIERQTPEVQPEATESFRRSLRQLIAQVRADGLPASVISEELKRLIEELTA